MNDQSMNHLIPHVVTQLLTLWIAWRRLPTQMQLVQPSAARFAACQARKRAMLDAARQAGLLSQVEE